MSQNDVGAVSSANVTSSQKSRPKAVCVSANSNERETAGLQNAADEPSSSTSSASGKRSSVYPVQRRGHRKKTLSLNPEEREALEHLIEEVIMGVGEGVIDSDESSTDDDENDDDADGDVISPSAPQNSVPGSSASVAVGDAAKQEAFVKGGKKFYPGQLKVALKHMHDLPPRFVRKLAKAQQYLDAGGSMYSKPAVTVDRIDEEEETQHFKEDLKPSRSVAAASLSPQDRDRDKARQRENKLKDAKKVIRTLLTDRDQYVDETLSSTPTSSSLQLVSTDANFLTPVSGSGDHQLQTAPVLLSPQRNAAARHSGTDVAASVGENNPRSLSSIDTHLHSVSVASSMSAAVPEYVPKVSDVHYQIGQSSSQSVSASVPIPAAHPYHPHGIGVPQYQPSVPLVHGMKPGPVLSQSPPGAQFWIPQAGFYGSSPPVVGMPGVSSAFSQALPYTYSIQPSYPSVPAVHAPYPPQYHLYSTSPPSQAIVGAPPFSAAPQRVSYAVVHPDQYVGPPTGQRPLPTDFYQNTPPPGYVPTQIHPTGDQRRHGYIGNTADAVRKQASSVDHSSSALGVPAHHCSVKDAARGGVINSEYASTPCTQEASRRTQLNMNIPGSQWTGVSPLASAGKIVPVNRPHGQHSIPDRTSAFGGQRPRFSKSPVNISSPRPSSPKTTNSSSNSTVAANSPAVSASQNSECVQSKVCAAADEIGSTLNTQQSNAEHSESVTKTTPAVLSSNTTVSVVSHSISDGSGSVDHPGRSVVDHPRSSGTDHLGNFGPPVVRTEGTSTSVDSSATEQGRESFADDPCQLLGDKNASPAQRDNHERDPGALIETGSSCVLDEVDTASRGAAHPVPSTSSSHTTQPSGAGETRSCEVKTAEAFEQELSRTDVVDSSISDNSQLPDISSSPVCPPQCTDITADIDLEASADVDMTETGSVVVTLSSRLTSALQEMFGPPPGPDRAVERTSVTSSRVCLSNAVAHELYMIWIQSSSDGYQTSSDQSQQQ